MLKKIFPFALISLLLACGNDDNINAEIIPPRLLAEQAPEDDAAIQDYLATHFYELVEDGIGGQRIHIDTIAGDNAGRTPMSAEVFTEIINVSSEQLGLSEEENDIPHTLYYIVAREGAASGLQPTFADSTLVRYEGSLLDRTKFDASSSFLWQQLPNTLRGYANGIAKFKSGTLDGLVQNSDGTSYYTDSGLGIIIMPSGLGYFLAPPTTSIPTYSPLVFSVEIGNVIVDTDADNDGIPSIMEDLNGNGYLFDDNTDSDSERNAGVIALANFQDPDDDDDGIPTLTEISNANCEIVFPYPDSDNDGTPDYLDPDVLREDCQDEE